jgi:xeroderma pigmentosum group C-complementing protein
MPSSVGGFKDHPVFAIEKHLKRDEVIHPLHQIGTFQGIKVYPRGNVVSCRSARQWYNEGRVVSDGQEALKWVKSRGYTLANKRAEEQARAEGGESPMEGLYAENQTELYQAPPVVDGEVPKNSFGNIDLFVPTMLPAGAAHIPYNGAGKVAKKLGISYAEAIVSRVQRLLELGLTRLSADWLRIPQVPQHAAPDGHRRARGVRGPRR